jgi:hypothetical protein
MIAEDSCTADLRSGRILASEAILTGLAVGKGKPTYYSASIGVFVLAIIWDGVGQITDRHPRPKDAVTLGTARRPWLGMDRLLQAVIAVNQCGQGLHGEVTRRPTGGARGGHGRCAQPSLEPFEPGCQFAH